MAAKFGVKKHIEQSCYDAGMARMREIFDLHDHVAVSFSGGKDSTCCLHLALEVAKEQNRLPVRVFTFDEEAIPPETVEYMARVAERPDITFEWYCLPIQHRNACSEKEPFWYCWDPAKRGAWCRDLPPLAITELAGFVAGGGIPEQIPILMPANLGAVANVMGVRSQESISRYRTIAGKRGWRAFMTVNPLAKHVNNCYPIYDWDVEDVWLAPQIMDWDYNRAYDTMEKCGMPVSRQRCAPPFGEQPIRGLYTFKECWPELWAKMCDRVPGAATAARYANTELYGTGSKAEDAKPANMSWRAYTMFLVDQLDVKSKSEVGEALKSLAAGHRGRAGGDVMPDADPHPVSGFCWRFLCKLAMIGGNKFGRQQQKVANLALAERKKRGILE
jgi:predicted phosphoadenosine phosphosulfate sulfurtransferase